MDGKRKIYFAAPLHEGSDRSRNMFYVNLLRKAGHLVYLPQEHGVWEDLLPLYDNDASKVRKALYETDMIAMKEADTCIALCDDKEGGRGPSEGMIWEMGWMTAAHKNVYLLNLSNWDYNLMLEFGSTKVFTDFSALMEFLEGEQFK